MCHSVAVAHFFAPLSAPLLNGAALMVQRSAALIESCQLTFRNLRKIFLTFRNHRKIFLTALKRDVTVSCLVYLR